MLLKSGLTASPKARQVYFDDDRFGFGKAGIKPKAQDVYFLQQVPVLPAVLPHSQNPRFPLKDKATEGD